MSGDMTWSSRAVAAALVMLFVACGGNDCEQPSPDADAEEDFQEDVESEPDTIEDPDAPEPDAVEDTTEEDGGPDAPLPVDCSAIVEYVTRESLLVHLEALDTIAAENGGTRVAGSPGWEASIDYVETSMGDYGYVTTRQAATYPYFEETTDPVMEMISPSSHAYTFSPDDPEVMTGDFERMHLSRPGDVTAEVEAVDLQLWPGNTSNSGCETADFTGFTVGHIALLQRGTCGFSSKALNADAAGAAAVIIFNQGDTTAREGLMLGGCQMTAMVPSDPEHGVGIPVVFASYAVGAGIAALLSSGPVVMHVQVSDVFDIRTSQNLLAETAAGDPDDIVFYGAHLDSDPDSPGMNDDASGIATVLEIARVVSECDPLRMLRFGFWSTEEWRRPWGSLQYLDSLGDTDRDRISMYFNVDMIASPNYAVFVLDGDGSDFWVPGPEGSAELEWFFTVNLMLQGYPTLPLWATGSDHWSFFMNDIPYGMAFAGAGFPEDIKTEEEAALFGGTAGEKYDPCHHEPCDTLDNVNMDIAGSLAGVYVSSAQFFGIDGMSVPPLP